jgi:hypothetical protein
MKRRYLYIIQRHTTAAQKFFMLRKLAFFFITVLDLENPFLTSLSTFHDANECTDRKDQNDCPFTAECVHSRLVE